MHAMHGRMHPSCCQITNLLVVDPLSSLAYPVMTHLLPVANKLRIKTLVAKQLPTNIQSHIHTYIYTYIQIYIQCVITLRLGLTVYIHTHVEMYMGGVHNTNTDT